MTRATRGLLILTMMLIGTACGGAGFESASRPRGQSDRITWEEMRERGRYSNLYDLVQELRPRWVRTQGPDTFVGTPGQVQVHMDGNHMGGVTVLRRLAAVGVTSIQWLSPIDAAARYGLNHSHGAIVISTRPVH